MKNQIVAVEVREIIVARFGPAALVKTQEGRFALRGGDGLQPKAGTVSRFAPAQGV